MTEVAEVARSVIVTGAGGGLGRAVVQRFREEGTDVLGIDRSRRWASTEPRVLGVTYPNAGREHRLLTDASDWSGLSSAVRRGVDLVGLPRALVVCAGVYRFDLPSHHVSVESLNAVLQSNLVGTFLACRAFLEIVVGRGGGASIVLVSSARALDGIGGEACYLTSKAGMLGLTASLADEYGPDGVRVNAVLPGPMETPMGFAALVARKGVTDPPDSSKTDSPVDVARTIAWLSSDRSSHINGSFLSSTGSLLRIGWDPRW